MIKTWGPRPSVVSCSWGWRLSSSVRPAENDSTRWDADFVPWKAAAFSHPPRRRTQIQPSPACGRIQVYFVSFVVFVVPLCSFNTKERNHERNERHENMTKKSSSTDCADFHRFNCRRA